MEFLKKEEEAKLDELEIAVPNDSQKLRKELMEHFASQAQHMENRISETNEKMESMNRKLAHFNFSFNEKFNSLGEQFNSMQLEKKIETISIQKNREEDLNQFLTKIGDKFSEQQVEMKLRAGWLDRKMEKMMEIMIQTAATVGSAGPGTIGTSQHFSPQNANVIGPSAPQSNPTDDAVKSSDPATIADVPNSEDDELQIMEVQFRKDLAEQTRVYEMKLRIARERRIEMNNFTDFYVALQLFFDTFSKELKGLGDLKMLTENLEAETKFNITFQFNYSGLRDGECSMNDYDPYPGSVSPDLRDRNKRIMISDDGELKWQPELKKRRIEEFSEVNVKEVQDLMRKFDIDEDVFLEDEYIVEFPLDEKNSFYLDDSTLAANDGQEFNEKLEKGEEEAKTSSPGIPVLNDSEMNEEAAMNLDCVESYDIGVALEELHFEDVYDLMIGYDIDDCSKVEDVQELILHGPIIFSRENSIVTNSQNMEQRAEEASMTIGSEMDMEHNKMKNSTADNNLEEPVSRPDPDYNDQFSSIDDEMERDFQQKLAEQNRLYEEKLANIRKKRIEKNEAALMEIRAIEERIRRARH
ncbi:unnamed protein product [Caenorhabditis brenneri]